MCTLHNMCTLCNVCIHYVMSIPLPPMNCGRGGPVWNDTSNYGLTFLHACFLPTRSAIHGRGLFCKRDIDAGEMVIEYAGEVIRSALCDKREKFYESKVQDGRHRRQKGQGFSRGYVLVNIKWKHH